MQLCTAWLTGETSERDSVYHPNLTAVMKQGAHFSGKAKGPLPRKTSSLEVTREHSDRGNHAYGEVEHKDELELKNILLTIPKEQVKLKRKHTVEWDYDYAGKKSAPQSKVPETRDAEVNLRPTEALEVNDPS